MMSKWLLVFILLVQAHFAASYLVPLREEDESAMGGVLRWAWPWANGDDGPLGTLVADGDNPLAGIFLGLVSASLLILAAMAVAGWWVPGGWWRALATTGAALLVVLMALFFGPTKLIPLAFALGTLFVTLARPDTFSVD
jgi:hypothetical protein